MPFNYETGEWYDDGQQDSTSDSSDSYNFWDPSTWTDSPAASFDDMKDWYTDTGEWDTSKYTGQEIKNNALPGQEGYGWRYFTDGTSISPDGKYYTAGSSTPVYDPSNQAGFWGGVSKVLGTGATNALKSKVMNADGSINPAAIGTAAMAIKSIFGGGNKVQTAGYQGSIPNLDAVRQQVEYTDPNRRPGESGRQYFTDVKYATAGNAAQLAEANRLANEQASGLKAAYTAAQPVTNTYKDTFAMPWQKKGATTADASSAVTVANPASTSTASVESPADRAKRFGALVPAARDFNAEMNALAAQSANTANTMIPNQTQPVTLAKGGIADLPRYLRGQTDGMADKINTTIDDSEPAKLSHGEFVIPADVVSHLGNGNSDAGADKLYQMMARIRKARTGNPEQGKRINPDKFMPGGEVKGYDGTNTSLVTSSGTTSTGTTGTSSLGTSSSNTLSPYVGDFVTNMLGKAQALSAQPYQVYKGPLTAGASDLQQQQFSGLSELAKTGLAPTQYTSGTFDTNAAIQYMNPYLQTALDPQLKEMQRQSDIARLSDAGRLTKAGAFGGSRQAIMESEARRNLLDKQGAAIGQGYSTAYDKAMAQYNADATRRLDTERAQQAANESSANFGLKTLQELGQAGATQRGITAEGIAADKAEFDKQFEYPYKQIQFQKDLLTGLPITTQENTQNTTQIGQINQQLAGILGLYQTLAGLIPTN